MPKIVIALVSGWAAGGGHSLHVVCDLSLSLVPPCPLQADRCRCRFDGGFGSAYLARQVGQKVAREIFFLGETYTAEDAYRMGMVNRVVPHADLETVGLEWAKIICGKSPTAQRMLKFAFNAIDDGLIGQQVFAGESTRLAYMTDEAIEVATPSSRSVRPTGRLFLLLLTPHITDMSAQVVATTDTDKSVLNDSCNRSPASPRPGRM